MSAELGLLKHIPCPKGDECTSFRCLFRHKGDENVWPLDGETKSKAPDASDTSGATQDGPRKRVKTHDQEYDPASPSVALVTPDISKQVESTKVPVSPPPLKRKVVVKPAGTLSNKAATPAKQSATSNGTPKMAIPVPAPAPVPSAKLARKTESLNPRHLKASPATHEARFKILKLLHGEIVRLNNELKKDANDEEEKLVLSDQELIWMALDEEEKFATDKPAIYSNTIKHRIMAYKRMSVSQWKEDRITALKKELAKSQPVKKKPAGGPPVVIETGLTPEQELSILARLRTPIHDMARYGYVPSIPTEQEIQKAREAEEISKGYEICDRCSTRFQVFPGRREEDGLLTSGGSCTHHPGRAYYPPRQPGQQFGDGVRRYRCCGQNVGDSSGCTTGETHVFKLSSPNRLALLWNFVETPPNPALSAKRAVCFDCEMGYTARGLELIRLTATAWPSGEELLDVLVQPLGEILDLNSRYSGVYPEDIVNALPFSTEPRPPAPELNEGERKRLQMVSSPEVARDLLFSLLSPETPLIGHGLENDLNCVRIVHPNIIDTVLLYPHSKGLPIRNGLKYLMETYLNRRIQVEEAGKLAGHDSGEDAKAAGELVRLRVQEEWNKMKKDGGWKLVHGVMIPPGQEGQLTEAFLEAKEA